MKMRAVFLCSLGLVMSLGLLSCRSVPDGAAQRDRGGMGSGQTQVLGAPSFGGQGQVRPAPSPGYGWGGLPSATQVPVFPQGAPLGRASSVLLIDARSGRPLAWRYPDRRRAVASTQKLLTALLVVEDGLLYQRASVAYGDTTVEPSKLGLRSGQSYVVHDLLKAFLIKSANDAAVTLARRHSGSVSAFAAAMNRKAYALGARDSSFKNPHGLTESGQYSTARDVSRFALAAYRNRAIRSMVGTKYFTFRFADGRRTQLKNTNKLLGNMSGCNGMKTGYTRASGRCLVSSAARGGHEVIVVQLGTKTDYIWTDARKLMEWGLGQLQRGSQSFLSQR